MEDNGPPSELLKEHSLPPGQGALMVVKWGLGTDTYQ